MDEDDLPIPESINILTPLLPPPPLPPALAPLPPATAPPATLPTPARPTTTRNLVLGKTQAKKRLLAFSMTKQGGGAGVSFNLAKKPILNKESAKGFNDDKEEGKKKSSKKGKHSFKGYLKRIFTIS